MHRLLKKIKSKQAETLLETLVSILIAVLSVTLLTTSVAASARMNKASKDADAKYNSDLQSAEAFTGTSSSGEVTFTFDLEGVISTVDVNVTYYGNGDFASYQITTP